MSLVWGFSLFPLSSSSLENPKSPVKYELGFVPLSHHRFMFLPEVAILSTFNMPLSEISYILTLKQHYNVLNLDSHITTLFILGEKNTFH